MNPKKPFSKDILLLDNIELVVDTIVKKLRENILHKLNRNGGVVGISGGIDSSVCLALSARALGPEKVLGVMMPEKDSNSESETLARDLAEKFGINSIKEDMTPSLAGFKCYERRDEAVKRVFPEYDAKTHKMKIGIRQRGLFNNLPPLFSLTIIDNEGHQKDKLLPTGDYLQIVAASNFKQRSRMSMVYYYAEANHYAVIGTPNKHEVGQGFFVKNGDGGADIMPIAHLYKTQVYQFAKYLDLPQKIINRTPTSDTYSAEQTQEEFFFQLPFKQMDLFWYGFENKYDPKEVGEVMDKTPEEVKSYFMGFERKIKTTEYLRMSPIRF
jgi:NAD+ synthase